MSTVPGDRAKKGKRSRIVVNVEPKPQEDRGAAVDRWHKTFRARRTGGRRRRALLVAAIPFVVILLLVFGVGWWWWQSFKSSPVYTLALVVDAAERDDRAAFEELVNVEGVSRSVVPQVIERVRGGDNALDIAPQVRRQIAQNAQVWLPGVREQVRDVLMAETKSLAERSSARSYPFLIRALALSRVAETTDGINGQEREVTKTVTFKVNERPVEFGMRASAASDVAAWRVESVKSDELATRVAEQVAKTFPMMGR
jgi:hypothetical protein